MFPRSPFITIGLFVILTGTVKATPSLDGTTVTAVYQFGGTSFYESSDLAVTSPFGEIVCTGDSLPNNGFCAGFSAPATLKVGPESISLTSRAQPAFTGFTVENLDFGPGYELTNFILATDLPGLTSPDITIGKFDGAYYIGFYEYSFHPSSPFQVDLHLLTSPVAVPEPSSLLAIGGIGVMSTLVAIRRRRRYLASRKRGTAPENPRGMAGTNGSSNVKRKH